MFVWIARLLLHAVALVIVSRLVPGVVVSDFGSAVIAVLVISLINALIKPILFLLTLPVTVLTLGLFAFVLNAFLFMLAGSLTPGLEISGFGAALIGALVYSVVSAVLLWLVR